MRTVCLVVLSLLLIVSLVYTFPPKTPTSTKECQECSVLTDKTTVVRKGETLICGPCEWKYGQCGRGVKPIGPYENFIDRDTGIMVECDTKTGKSRPFSCEFQCSRLIKTNAFTACKSCKDDIAKVISLGKNCNDIRNRYSSITVGKNTLTDELYDNLIAACIRQTTCNCYSKKELLNTSVSYDGTLKTTRLEYDTNLVKEITKYYGGECVWTRWYNTFRVSA
jgi:hypothetical protein